MKRIVVYVEQVQHRDLKSKLASQGTSVSDWFRAEVDEFLGGKKISEKKIPIGNEGMRLEFKGEPVVEDVHQVPPKGSTCSWDKGFNCKSPGTVFVKGKWWCTPHGLEV